MKSFTDIDDIVRWDPTEFCDGMFLLPRRWNQGGFDAVNLKKWLGFYLLLYVIITPGETTVLIHMILITNNNLIQLNYRTM